MDFCDKRLLRAVPWFVHAEGGAQVSGTRRGRAGWRGEGEVNGTKETSQRLGKVEGSFEASTTEERRWCKAKTFKVKNPLLHGAEGERRR